MKQIKIKYIWLVIYAILSLGCPSPSSKDSSVVTTQCTSLSVCSINDNIDTGTDTNTNTSLKQLYYSTTLSRVELGGAVASAVSPDHKNVYVVGTDHKVVVFKRDTSTGALAFVEALVNGANGVQGLNKLNDVIVSPDGKNVYVTSVNFNAIIVFTRNTSTGKLAYKQMLQDGGNGGNGLAGVNTISMSPDGKNVYATSSTENTVTVFGRDLNDGTLTYEEVLQHGGNDSLGNKVEGLDGVIAVAVSPDGNNVYVASYTSNALVVFTRNINNGKLVYKQMLQNTNTRGGIDGLSSAIAITVSPDNKNVYVIGNGTIAVFTRNNGTLTFLEVLKDDAQLDGTINGLASPNAVAVSPDNNHVYVSSAGDHSLVEFKRSTSTGALVYSNMFKNGEKGVTGFQGTEGVTVSPDGNNVYVTSKTSGSISVFNRK